MSLVKYEPWFGARQLQDDINRLFSGLMSNESSSVNADWVPNVDINEFDDKFQLYVDVPGVDPKNVDITLEAGVLTISGNASCKPKSPRKTSSAVVRNGVAAASTGASCSLKPSMRTRSRQRTVMVCWRS